MNNLLGANWRTTLSGWIAVLASAIAINPSLIAFLPESLRGYITGAAGLIAILSGGTFATQTKDKQVTGGIVPNDPPKSATSPLVPLLLFAALMIAITGCSTLAQWQANPKVQTAENDVLQFVENCALSVGISAIDQYATGGKIDGRTIGAAALSGAASALRSIESTSSASDSNAVAAAVQSWAGVTSVANTVAPVAASAVSIAVQQGAPPDAAVEKVASGLDAAAATVSE